MPFTKMKQNCEVVCIRLRCFSSSCLHCKNIPLVSMHTPRYADAAQPTIFLEVFRHLGKALLQTICGHACPLAAFSLLPIQILT